MIMRYGTAPASIAAHMASVIRRTEPMVESKSRGGAALLVGETESIRDARRLIERIAASPSNVLVTGETGTGKDLFARSVHAASPRRLRPFIAINCGAIPESLMESQLFGHVRGAFTGAVDACRGLLVAAAGGTFVLDEIGELPLPLQVKLLRVIEQREVWAVGATRPSPIDVRLIATTNRDLVAEAAAGRFRQDLFYRLKVIHVVLPTLRERIADLPMLAVHFIEKLNLKLDTAYRALAPDALDVLMKHRWPGNVRELENAIERGMAMGSGDTITLADLPDELRHGVEGAARR
jgi:transcriptional regulator with PAS, ATPase and Fis domain